MLQSLLDNLRGVLSAQLPSITSGSLHDVCGLASLTALSKVKLSGMLPFAVAAAMLVILFVKQWVVSPSFKSRFHWKTCCGRHRINVAGDYYLKTASLPGPHASVPTTFDRDNLTAAIKPFDMQPVTVTELVHLDDACMDEVVEMPSRLARAAEKSSHYDRRRSVYEPEGASDQKLAPQSDIRPHSGPHGPSRSGTVPVGQLRSLSVHSIPDSLVADEDPLLHNPLSVATQLVPGTLPAAPRQSVHTTAGGPPRMDSGTPGQSWMQFPPASGTLAAVKQRRLPLKPFVTAVSLTRRLLWDYSSSLRPKYITAVINLLLTVYSSFLLTVAALLNCVHVPGTDPGTTRLFIQGSVECAYSGWQAIYVFAAVVLLAMPLCIPLATYWVNKQAQQPESESLANVRCLTLAALQYFCRLKLINFTSRNFLMLVFQRSRLSFSSSSSSCSCRCRFHL